MYNEQKDREYEATLVTDNLMQAGDYTLKIPTDGRDKTATIFLDYARIRNFRFERVE